VQLTILEVIDRGPNIRSLRFDKPKNFTYTSGQFVMISVPVNGKIMKRAYSLASSPTEDYLEITLKAMPQGTVSPVLANLEKGTSLEVKGPFGMFKLDEHHTERLVLVAGGTGITPIRSILRTLVNEGKAKGKISLVYGARAPEEVIYKEEFEIIHKEHDNVGIYFTVAEGENWPWHKGFLSAKFIAECVPDHKQATYYLCGPPKMVEVLLHDLSESGVDPKKIHVERW